MSMERTRLRFIEAPRKRRTRIAAVGAGLAAYLLAQAGLPPDGGKIVWAPGAKPLVVWASPDPNARHPAWLDVVPVTLLSTSFFTSGTSFADPGNWNDANNKIEVISLGASGTSGSKTAGGNGGRGGSYASRSNIPLLANGDFPVTIAFGSTTSFNASHSGREAVAVTASSGSIGAVVHTGGAGQTGNIGGKGGGAGGPDANGVAGSSGGAANGGISFQWDASHKPGNGGGTDADGQDYGGGGGGGHDGGGAAGGQGGSGGAALLVITYSPNNQASATITGHGTVAANAQPFHPSNATLYGVAYLAEADVIRAAASATLTGSASLDVGSTNITAAISATLQGAGQVFGDADWRASARATLQGAGSIFAEVDVNVARADINGVGALLVDARHDVQAGAFLQGEGGVRVHAELSKFKRPFHRIDDYLTLVTSEHNDKPNYMAMLTLLLQPMSEIQALISAVPDFFDIDLAIGAQLDVVGQWVGKDRYLSTPIAVYFSFDTEGLGWDQGRWKGPYDPDEGMIRLDDEPYRTLLRAVAAANEWDGTIPGSYTVWEKLGFNVLVQDNANMSMLVALQGPLPDAVTFALLTGGYIKLRPAGVKVEAYVTETVANAPFFGFDVENSNIAGFDVGAWGKYNVPEERDIPEFGFDAPRLVGEATLSVETIQIAAAQADVIGTGSVTVPTKQIAAISATLAGHGVVFGIAGVAFGSKTLTGTATVSASAVVRRKAEAEVDGAASLTVTATGGLP